MVFLLNYQYKTNYLKTLAVLQIAAWKKLGRNEGLYSLFLKQKQMLEKKTFLFTPLNHIIHLFT